MIGFETKPIAIFFAYEKNICLKRCTGFWGPQLERLKFSIPKNFFLKICQLGDMPIGEQAQKCNLIILTGFRLQIYKISLGENKILTCLTKIYPLFKGTVFHNFRKNFGPLLTSHRLKLPNLRKLLNQKNILRALCNNFLVRYFY